MKSFALILFSMVLSSWTPAAAQTGGGSDDPYVRVSVDTRGDGNGVSEFTVLYYRARPDVEDGYFLCKKNGSGYSIAPRTAYPRRAGYFTVRSNADISREEGRKIYFDKDSSERDMAFPINIRPAGDKPIEIEVSITFTD